MAGKPKLKAAFAVLDKRGGPEALQEYLLSGRTIPDLARELGMDRGYLRKNIMKHPDYSKAVKEVMAEAADAHADEAFERLRALEEKREAEIAKALDPKDKSVDVSVALTNQVDMGIAKGYAQQHNFIAASYNKSRYGSGSQQSVTINIGDLHLDALRKAKVIEHE